MDKLLVKEMLIQMLQELEIRHQRIVKREWAGNPPLASNATWKAQAIIVDVAENYGINIQEEEYEMSEDED